MLQLCGCTMLPCFHRTEHRAGAKRRHRAIQLTRIVTRPLSRDTADTADTARIQQIQQIQQIQLYSRYSVQHDTPPLWLRLPVSSAPVSSPSSEMAHAHLGFHSLQSPTSLWSVVSSLGPTQLLSSSFPSQRWHIMVGFQSSAPSLQPVSSLPVCCQIEIGQTLDTGQRWFLYFCFPTGGGPWPRAPSRAWAPLSPGIKQGCGSHHT